MWRNGYCGMLEGRNWEDCFLYVERGGEEKNSVSPGG